MFAQSHVDITCSLIIWSDLKALGHFVLMLIVSDTVSFPTSSPNQHDNALSTDIAPRSSYWDIFPSELMSFYGTILNMCIKISKYTFLYSVTILCISILLQVINFVLVPAKFLVFLSFFSVCYRILYFLIRLLHRMFRVCIRTFS